MYKNFIINGYKFDINQLGWGVIVDAYDGKAIEIDISTIKKMIEVYEKEFPKRENTIEGIIH